MLACVELLPNHVYVYLLPPLGVFVATSRCICCQTMLACVQLLPNHAYMYLLPPLCVFVVKP